MELYGALFSPFVRKVAVVAAEKRSNWTLPPSILPIHARIS